MKLLYFQLAISVFGSFSYAIPVDYQQVLLDRNTEQRQPEHSLLLQTTSTRERFGFEVSAVVSSVDVKPETPNSHGGATAVVLLSSRSSPSTWGIGWIRDALMKKATGDPYDCFCAGVSICCYNVQSFSCNYGICGS